MRHWKRVRGRRIPAGCGAVDDATLGERAGVPAGFIVGMEEGMFPSQMSLDEGGVWKKNAVWPTLA